MVRSYSYGEMLRLTDRLRGPAIERLLESLRLPPGSRGLDVGCGVGLYTPHMAELIGPSGTVVGLDAEAAFLREAQAAAVNKSFERQVEYCQGDFMHLPFADASFDWLVSIDTIWPGRHGQSSVGEEPVPVVTELKRVVKPGGTLALVYWSSHRLLPGHPQLEARLQATSGATAPFADTMPPSLHFMSALTWLCEAGMMTPRTVSAVADITGPLTDAARAALAATFAMLWERSRSEVCTEDWAEYQRLCDPESPDFIGANPAYHGIITYTAYTGVV